ncbi:alpha-mannosidase [Clostridiales bacterium TF09-2AC]|nr:alpha-mannosidase [Clostridiales bacterium TF09-2AC]
MQFIDERNEKLIKETGNLRWSDAVSIENYQMACTGDSWKDAGNIGSQEWKDFSADSVWGGNHTFYWFCTDIVIPDHFHEKCVVYELRTGREGSWDATNPQFRVYLNGVLKQGLDVNHREVILSESAKAGDIYRLQLSAFTGNQNMGLRLESGIKVLHREIEKYYYDLAVPQNVLELLEPDCAKAMVIRRALTASLNLLDLRKPYSKEFFDSLKQAQDYMDQEFYKKECGRQKEAVYTVGHTHIDVAWLWTLAVTRDKAVRSFSSALELMRQYPEFIFMSSQPQLYEYVKENAPDVYAQIRQRVREGRWEAEGGMFLEADCNLSSGESLIRQFVYGKRFFMEEFGVDNEILWLPDVFGYSAALPQIMEKCGIHYFMTTKISWNETNKMPYDTFLWEGIDGTRILTHFISARDYNASLLVEGKKRPPHFTTYNGNLNASQVKGTWQRYSQKELNDQALMCFGYGDGGGGPTREMLENQRRLSQGIPGCLRTRMSTAGEFFAKLEQEVSGKKELPAWVGELYLEYHRGTYTSMARNKKYNRRGEFLLENLEGLEAVLGLWGAEQEDHREELEELWKILLRNQFHDILPGSSCGEVYEDSKKEYTELFERGNALKSAMLRKLTGRIQAEEGSLIVYNMNAFGSSGIVFCPYPQRMVNPSACSGGAACPIQKTHDGNGIFITPVIPAKGNMVFSILDMEKAQTGVTFDGQLVETPYFTVKLNRAGQFTSFVDKRTGRELIKANETGNRLVTYEDRPHYYDAWDINDYYTEKAYPIDTDAQITVLESGPVRTVIRVVHMYLDSRIQQDLIFYSQLDRIDLQYQIDWREKQILLRNYFPVNIHASEATYEIQYGNVKRATHRNTSWDQAKFEVCAHKWIDLSEDDYGLSILNDCKYGCDIHDGVIGLTLLKSAVYPNPDADREHHGFAYSLCPHEGSWKTAGIIQKAYAFNNPMEALVKEESGGPVVPGQAFAAVDSSNVILEVIKPADDGNGIIVRLYEAFNRDCVVRLKLASQVRAAFRCNMLEQDQAELAVDGDTVPLHVKPYEIQTIRLLM